MMSVETMRSVNPKTVGPRTLVQRDSIRLEPAAAQDDPGAGFYPTDQKPVLLSGREDSREDQLLEDRHHLGGRLEHYLRGL